MSEITWAEQQKLALEAKKMDRGTVYGLRVLELQRQIDEMKQQVGKREQLLFEERRKLHDVAPRVRNQSYRGAELIQRAERDRGDSK